MNSLHEEVIFCYLNPLAHSTSLQNPVTFFLPITHQLQWP